MLVGGARWHGLAALSLSLLFVFGTCQSEGSSTVVSIVCTEESRVRLLPDGNLSYGSLPPTEPPDLEDYSPQGLAGWYNLARGFVNLVQPENLPYDVIEATIEENDLPCRIREDDCGQSEADVEMTLRDFGEWWAPLIAVTVLGGIMAIMFGVVGSIFWCCRCCGQCGGGRSKTDPQDKCMFVVTVLLLLIALLLFVGVVLSFYSNEQSYDTIESLQETVNEIIDIALNYVDNFLSDGDALFCQFVQVTDISLDETMRLNSSLYDLIDEVGVDVNSILQQLEGLSSGIDQTSNILMNVSVTTQTLQTLSSELTATLSSITSDVDDLASDCVALGAPQCGSIPEPATFQPSADYSALPDVTQELNNVQDSLDGINLMNSIEEGNAEFERISEEIQSEINTNLGGLDGSSSSGVLGTLFDANSTIFETRDNVTGDIREMIRNDYDIEDCPSLGEIFGGDADDEDADVGFIRQCYFNQIFERVQEYDVYRYAFGIIICCLSLLTFVLTLVGITLGVLGWSKDRSPDSRTRLSHYGGIVLLINIGLTFLFGVVLLILASLAFFFGSNMQKICQAVDPSEYELFTRIVDNRELWEGSLLGELVLGSGENLSLSDALQACDNNEALYTAFNLSSQFNVSDLLDTSDIFDELEQELDDTIDSFNYTSDSFLDDDARSALNDFTSAGVDAINITAFNETLSASILAFNLTDTINSLQSLQMDLPPLAVMIGGIITQLMDIQNRLVPDIEANVALLGDQVGTLSDHIDGVVLDTNTVVGEIDDLVANLTGEYRERVRSFVNSTLENLESYVDSFLDHIEFSVETNVGRCKPVANIYQSAYDLVCNEAVDGLNGYWWSLGFCAVCFIPLIILAVIASTHYLRQRKDDGEDSYPEYPMKAK